MQTFAVFGIAFHILHFDCGASEFNPNPTGLFGRSTGRGGRNQPGYILMFYGAFFTKTIQKMVSNQNFSLSDHKKFIPIILFCFIFS